MKNTAIFDADLNPLLEIASNEDLETLVEYLNQKFSETLSVNDAYKAHTPNHSKYADLIAKEIREMGGNSFANAYRGEGPSYHEIVCDVAKKLKAPFNEKKSVEDIENTILEIILTQTLDSMSESEREELLKEMGGKAGFTKGGAGTAAFITIFRAGGFKSYQLTVIIANQIAKMILGHGLKFAAGASLTRAMSILTGPIGMTITALWTLVDLAGPSYKVTIPSVIHTAMLRKKLGALECSGCNAVIPDTMAKFCSECGEAV